MKKFFKITFLVLCIILLTFAFISASYTIFVDTSISPKFAAIALIIAILFSIVYKLLDD